MAGAYTAKPADPVVDTKPPGWGSWPFPPVFAGTIPPGYEPEYSLPGTGTGPVGVAAGGSIRYGQDSDVELILYDQETYQTGEPNEDTILLTAEVGGRRCMEPTTVSYEELGNFWGHTGNYLFSLVEDDQGEQIWFSAYSEINGWPVWGDIYIQVYDPVFSLSIDNPSPSNVTIDDPTMSAIVKLYDAIVYATGEPEDYEITWTATVEDREVMEPITTSYSNVEGSFWGDNSSFEFDLIEDDAGKVVILRVEGTVWGDDEVSDEVEITIGLLPVSIETTLTVTSSNVGWPSAPRERIKVERLPSSSSRTEWPAIGTDRGAEHVDPEPWWGDNGLEKLPEISCIANGPSKFIAVSGTFNADSNYRLTYLITEGGNATVSVTVSVAITMSDNSVLSGEVSHTIIPYGDNETEIVTASTQSGAVYIFGVRVN